MAIRTHKWKPSKPTVPDSNFQKELQHYAPRLARLDWRRTRHPAYTHLSVSKTAKAIDTFELLRECRCDISFIHPSAVVVDSGLDLGQANAAPSVPSTNVDREVLAEGGRVDSSRVENITYILRTMQLEDADQFMAPIKARWATGSPSLSSSAWGRTAAPAGGCTTMQKEGDASPRRLGASPSRGLGFSEKGRAPVLLPLRTKRRPFTEVAGVLGDQSTNLKGSLVGVLGCRACFRGSWTATRNDSLEGYPVGGGLKQRTRSDWMAPFSSPAPAGGDTSARRLDDGYRGLGPDTRESRIMDTTYQTVVPEDSGVSTAGNVSVESLGGFGTVAGVKNAIPLTGSGAPSLTDPMELDIDIDTISWAGDLDFTVRRLEPDHLDLSIGVQNTNQPSNPPADVLFAEDESVLPSSAASSTSFDGQRRTAPSSGSQLIPAPTSLLQTQSFPVSTPGMNAADPRQLDKTLYNYGLASERLRRQLSLLSKGWAGDEIRFKNCDPTKAVILHQFAIELGLGYNHDVRTREVSMSRLDPVTPASNPQTSARRPSSSMPRSSTELDSALCLPTLPVFQGTVFAEAATPFLARHDKGQSIPARRCLSVDVAERCLLSAESQRLADMKAVFEGASYKLSISDAKHRAYFVAFIEAGRYRDHESLHTSYSVSGKTYTYTELIAIIAWELAENHGLLSLLEIKEWNNFMNMIETACIYESEIGQTSLVILSVICLRHCLEALRLHSAQLLTPSAHEDCCGGRCQVECIQNLTTRIAAYIDELSAVIFNKENMRDRRWWLSTFYSLYIQSYVRHALIAIEKILRFRVLDDAPTEDLAATQYLHLPTILFTAASAKYDPLFDGRLQQHEAEKPHPCTQCKKRFKSPTEAERHINAIHLKSDSWSCKALENCLLAFQSETFNGVVWDVCGFCGGGFARNHSKGNSDENGVIGGDSNEATPEHKAELVSHLESVHKIGECDRNKKFYRADNFRQHLKNTHVAKPGKWLKTLERVCRTTREEEPSA
ncbi:uncharacterized protein CTHT_0003940 [Thermochaetoides thermophila DSM 1495]|uniref:C2H2-type domain-containing protein n=1 Tax=Chaetomium thermophilum (strain DSM 1495 / CBS 144.50 / IMI 039719) TaxID=759272 RepID=G0RZR8_CHATD|nr:hypothetical protein CTHT_0003940 [Thermochaetoides thermophila DSM 1495]EGS23696.1 hypothetical protein CTHT_0003940 [Thermochaetoides thermophila DSM 1495]